MKISLLTIWRVRNYGAELQAYATIKILKQMGHDVEIVNFRLGDLDKSIKKRIENIVFYLCIGNYKFLRFWNKYFSTSSRYKSVDYLKNNPPKADLYLVGSDQVWNPAITQSASSLFFLDYGIDNIRKASYASSFGTTTWDKDELVCKYVNEHLRNFDKLSCREFSGVEILKDKFEIDAINVLDPTLLFSDYKELIGNPKTEATLAYYPLKEFAELEIFSKELTKELFLEHRVVNWKTKIMGVVWNRASIEDWIRTIAQSRIVVTQSFHGLAFSLIYNKEFIIVIQDSKRATRIINLLTQLGLENRFFSSVEDARKSKIWEEKIDYEVVNKKLNILRELSINYLNEILV